MALKGRLQSEVSASHVPLLHRLCQTPGVYMLKSSQANYVLSAKGWCKHCHYVDHISETCPACWSTKKVGRRVALSTTGSTTCETAIKSTQFFSARNHHWRSENKELGGQNSWTWACLLAWWSQCIINHPTYFTLPCSINHLPHYSYYD